MSQLKSYLSIFASCSVKQKADTIKYGAVILGIDFSESIRLQFSLIHCKE